MKVTSKMTFFHPYFGPGLSCIAVGLSKWIVLALLSQQPINKLDLFLSHQTQLN